MDIDALKATRKNAWDRLKELGHRSRLTGEEIDELGVLYESVTADLARIRSESADPDTIQILSRELATARATLTGSRGNLARSVSRWFRIDLPAALYSVRWWTLGTAIVFGVIAALQAGYLLMNPELFSLLGSPTELNRIAHQDFVQYYYQDTNAEFATSVWVNNAFIALRVVGLGPTGFLPVYILYHNAQTIGVMAAIVIHHAGWWQFFRFILPHGIPELTAVFIASAAGLKIFWAIVNPGHRTRLQAVGQTGRAMVTVALGMVILLFISGILEGFVTPSKLPDFVRIGAGVFVTAGYWFYTLVIGGRAWRAGYSGDMDDEQGGYYQYTN